MTRKKKRDATNRQMWLYEVKGNCSYALIYYKLHLFTRMELFS